jgi:hypothetical protein
MDREGLQRVMRRASLVFRSISFTTRYEEGLVALIGMTGSTM